jgi:WD40 repeat protein
VWDTKTWREILHLEHRTIIWDVAFSPRDDQLLTCGEDSTLVLWDIESGKRRRTFHGHENAVRSCAISPDGRLVIGGGGRSFTPAAFQPASADYSVRVWESDSGHELAKLDGHSEEVRNVAFLGRNEQAVSTALGDEMAIVWDLQKMTPIHTIRAVEQEGTIEDVKSAFAPDKRTLLTFGQVMFSGGIIRLDIKAKPYVRLWNLETGRQVRDYGVNSRGEHSAAFGPLPNTFVTVDLDWLMQDDPQDYEKLGNGFGGDSLSFGTIRLREADSGELLTAYIRGGPRFDGSTLAGPVATSSHNNLVACGRSATGLVILKLVENESQ